MSNFLLILKRLFVLLLGVALVWFAAFNFFPWVDDRLPLVLAVIVTYIVVAYIGLPAIGRIWRLLHKSNHLPTRTISGDGWALDPINIALISSNERELTRSMKQAGWLRADKLTLLTLARIAFAIAFNRPYPNAPFSTQYVFGRPQDLGFQIPIGNSPRRRHHVRFWRLGTTMLEDDHEHHGFWRSLLNRFLQKKKQVWVGAAILDKGLNIRKRTLQIDHGIDGDTNAERDYLVETLKNAGVLKNVTGIKAGEPLHTKHQGFREKIIADGYIKLCELKHRFAIK